VTGVITIREGYLTALITAFLIELAGAVIAIFKSANFFAPEKNEIPAEEEIWKSIRKLDTAFGYLQDSAKAQAMHFHCRLSYPNTSRPPRALTSWFLSEIESNVGKIRPNRYQRGFGDDSRYSGDQGSVQSSIKK